MYDAIVVGARCAGAPTAMLLARKGHRVLLVDKAKFPSDTLSTHIVWPHGGEILHRWGLWDRLAASGCPPVALRMIFDLGPVVLKGGVTDSNAGRGGLCPRRTVLDKILVDSALEAEAEVREGFAVEALLRDGERITGIRGRSASGAIIEERARIVIGADGVNSLVAKSVGALEYDVKPPLAAYCYGYYSGFSADDLEQHFLDHQGVGCFPTHNGLTLIAVVWPSHKFKVIRSELERHYEQVCASSSSVAERIRSARRETNLFATAGVPNYFRKPYGPGWALVGDAGYDKDPITAQGISDAFVDADIVANALHDGWSGRRPLEDALAEYHSTRDRRVNPMYEFTCEQATLEPPPPEMQQLFAALQYNAPATNRFFSAITGSSPLPEFMSEANLKEIMEKQTR